MSGLIRRLAAVVTDFIQAGSIRNAFIGAFFGVLAVGTAAYALWASGHIDRWPVAAIPIAIVAGLAGAIAGSRLPDRGHTDVLPGETVTVWNLNSSLAPLTIIALLGGFLVVGGVFFSSKSKDPPSPAFLWGIGAGSVLLFAISACKVTYGIELRQGTVRVLRLPSARIYERSKVQRWGFEIRRGTIVTEPPVFRAPFLIQLADGHSYFIVVSPVLAKRIAAVM